MSTGKERNHELPARAYLSNINSMWPFRRQERVLAERVPGWPNVSVYRDEITPRQRQAHSPAALAGRAQMLRPSARNGGDTIYVASLAVLAWDGADFDAVMEALAQRAATVWAGDLDIGFVAGLDGIRDAFRASRKRASVEARQKAGAQVSAAKRRAASDAGVERIRDRWPLPSSDWRTADLLAEAGVSRNTVNARLGGREMVQKRHQAALKRRMKREQRPTD